ncbi:MAG: LptA/OstA family protein [Desulfococcaceae bacterium]
MTVSRCNRRDCIRVWVWLVLATVLVSGIGYGQTAAAPAKETEEAERIHITADSLVADDNEKFAEFSGNVKAVQGGTEITADRLRILYQGSPAAGETAESDPAAGAQGSIQRITAVGQVQITFDEMVAQAHEAVYTTADRILVLSGPDSKVTRPDSGTISGSRITVERDTGRIRFEGNVEGIFIPGEKGLN